MERGAGTCRTKHRIPLALKLTYTAFVAVLVPYYWITYSPWNFLFFCDVALLITLAALWTEDPLLMSLPAVGITVPQMLWVVDFLTGSRITGMTSYMFDPKLPLFVRGLSAFHGWLPFLLIWGVWRLGYDRRAFAGWTVIGTAVLLASFFLAPAPPAPLDHPTLAVNLNYVHGLSYEPSPDLDAPRALADDLPRRLPRPLLPPGASHLSGHGFPRRTRALDAEPRSSFGAGLIRNPRRNRHERAPPVSVRNSCPRVAEIRSTGHSH